MKKQTRIRPIYDNNCKKLGSRSRPWTKKWFLPSLLILEVAVDFKLVFYTQLICQNYYYTLSITLLVVILNWNPWLDSSRKKWRALPQDHLSLSWSATKLNLYLISFFEVLDEIQIEFSLPVPVWSCFFSHCRPRFFVFASSYLFETYFCICLTTIAWYPNIDVFSMDVQGSILSKNSNYYSECFYFLSIFDPLMETESLIFWRNLEGIFCLTLLT